jgi:hypothetical protein
MAVGYQGLLKLSLIGRELGWHRTAPILQFSNFRGTEPFFGGVARQTGAPDDLINRQVFTEI